MLRAVRGFVFAIVALHLSGCAAQRPLPLPGSEPDTTASDKQFWVGYSIAPAKLVGIPGVIVAVKIKNISGETVTAIPSMHLLDNYDQIVSMPELQAVLDRAAMRAQRPIPNDFYSAPGGYYTIRATATDAGSGRRYDIQGTAQQSSFASGFAQGAAIADAVNRKDAEDVFTWASVNWLKERYTLPPGVSVAGEVFMPFFNKPLPTQTSFLEVYLHGGSRTIQVNGQSRSYEDWAKVKFVVPETKFK